MAIIDIPGIESFGGPAPIGAIHYSKELEKRRIEKAQEKVVKTLGFLERYIRLQPRRKHYTHRIRFYSRCCYHDAQISDQNVVRWFCE